ncbi:MAG: type II toxin-antitoxin system VapC family toxin [Paracoccaceae bacterium]
MSVVLDTSAILAALWDEPGGKMVAEHMPNAEISAVNLAELYSKLLDRGAEMNQADAVIDSLGLRVISFDGAQGRDAGALRQIGRAVGLSLGDQACLALAKSQGARVYTADRAWARLDSKLDIVIIR